LETFHSIELPADAPCCSEKLLSYRGSVGSRAELLCVFGDRVLRGIHVSEREDVTEGGGFV
jgi:hypothetical protein